MTAPAELFAISYRAFNERDEATLRRIYAPDAIWDGSNFPGFPGRTRYIGPDGILEFIDEWWSAWEEFEVAPSEIIAGPRGVFIRGELHMRARDGLELRVDMGQVAHLDPDGRIAAVYNYADADQARREAGL